MTEEELKPCLCPWCNGIVHIRVTDSCGNIRDDEYEKRSHHRDGLFYKLVHDENDIPQGKTCPIATHDYEMNGMGLGIWLYGSRKEAVQSWNANNEPQNIPEWLKEKIVNRLRTFPEKIPDIYVGDEYLEPLYQMALIYKREMLKWVLSIRRDP